MTTDQNTRTPMLEVRNVSKHYGSVNSLQDVSLAVYSGEVTCVLGDNGAGKSTLIKILSGVVSYDEGEYLIEGEPVHLSAPRQAQEHGIATVFHSCQCGGTSFWETSQRKAEGCYNVSMPRRLGLSCATN